MNLKPLVATMAIALTGCGPQGPAQQSTHLKETPYSAEGSRFDVRLEAKFVDVLAYSSYRGIYVITDRKTGREYVGISGVGITEIGAHDTDGKGSKAEDER